MDICQSHKWLQRNENPNWFVELLIVWFLVSLSCSTDKIVAATIAHTVQVVKAIDNSLRWILKYILRVFIVCYVTFRIDGKVKVKICDGDMNKINNYGNQFPSSISYMCSRSWPDPSYHILLLFNIFITWKNIFVVLPSFLLRFIEFFSRVGRLVTIWKYWTLHETYIYLKL